MIELESCRRLDRSNNYPNNFTRLDSNVTYDHFFRQYLEPNFPCMFESSLTKNWEASKNWVRSDGLIDVDHLSTTFGKLLFFL